MLEGTAQCAYIGSIGQDAYGENLTNALTEEHVKNDFYKTSEAKTGRCAVLIVDKERSLIADVAAAKKFPVSHMQACLPLVDQAKICYFSSFFLDSCKDAAQILVEHASNTGKVMAINLGATFLCQFYKQQQLDVLPYVEYIFGNESEAVVFAEAHNLGTTDVVEIAKKMADPAVFPLAKAGLERKVIITQGCDPTVVATGTSSVITLKPKQLPNERLVDVNGAGDSFVGGFLAMLSRGEPITKCVQAGHYCARIIIQTSGCVLPKNRPNFNFIEPVQA